MKGSSVLVWSSQPRATRQYFISNIFAHIGSYSSIYNWEQCTQLIHISMCLNDQFLNSVPASCTIMPSSVPQVPCGNVFAATFWNLLQHLTTECTYAEQLAFVTNEVYAYGFELGLLIRYSCIRECYNFDYTDVTYTCMINGPVILPINLIRWPYRHSQRLHNACHLQSLSVCRLSKSIPSSKLRMEVCQAEDSHGKSKNVIK